LRRPKVCDRGAAEGGEPIRFTSAILPAYLRRTKNLEELLPWLYLKGVSTGQFAEALTALLGPDAQGLPLVYTAKGVKRRKIRGMDLGAYRRPDIPGNRNLAWRAAWYLVNAFLFQGAVLSLIPGSWKAAVLRAFGAKVGRGLVCKPWVTIKYPWFLEIGDHVWLGERVWIDNVCLVRIGSNVCLSQGVYILTGNHDWDDPQFAFVCKPVTVGSGVWLAACTRLGPGSTIPSGYVLADPFSTRDGILHGRGVTSWRG
jgi:putative colanic acid biosynthesis acetyltransferase WcaF